MRVAEAGVVLLCTGLAYATRAAFGPPRPLALIQLGATGFAAMVLLATLWIVGPGTDTLTHIVKTTLAVLAAAITTLALSFLGWFHSHSRMTFFFFFAYSLFGVTAVRILTQHKKRAPDRRAQHPPR